MTSNDQDWVTCWRCAGVGSIRVLPGIDPAVRQRCDICDGAGRLDAS